MTDSSYIPWAAFTAEAAADGLKTPVVTSFVAPFTLTETRLGRFATPPETPSWDVAHGAERPFLGVFFE